MTWYKEHIWFNDDYNGDYHAVATITLQELEEMGFFDWSLEMWDWSEFAYNPEQYKRICDGFSLRYRWREISVTPPLQWRDLLLAKIKYELCPKYNRWYKLRDDMDNLDYSIDRDEYGKSRDIGSEFPETLLSANEVYASNGKDVEFETIRLRNQIDDYDTREKIARLNLDTMFLDELESFFNGVWVNDTQAW